MCKRYPGFLRVAIADPQPERRWFRRGWVTFERQVNIKEICWNLNNIRVSPRVSEGTWLSVVVVRSVLWKHALFINLWTNCILRKGIKKSRPSDAEKTKYLFTKFNMLIYIFLNYLFTSGITYFRGIISYFPLYWYWKL